MENKIKVLVIDDDVDTLDAVRLSLESRGLDVLTADGPDKGLRQLETGHPDAVLLDIMMPHGTEGFHWVWNVRKHSDSSIRDVPILVMSSIHSAMPFRFNAGDADETGDYLPVQGFLEKPADPDEILRKIKSLVSAKT